MKKQIVVMNRGERSYGTVAVPMTAERVILAIPYLDENHGKQEGLAWSKDLLSAVGMQYPGGAIKSDTEQTLETMTREWKEETHFEVNKDRFEPLPIGTAIMQTGGSRGEIWFGVELYRLILTADEENLMRNDGAVEITGEQDVELRPRDKIITQLYWAVCEGMDI